MVLLTSTRNMSPSVADLGAGIGPVDEDRIGRGAQRSDPLLLDVEDVVGQSRGHPPVACPVTGGRTRAD